MISAEMRNAHLARDLAVALAENAQLRAALIDLRDDVAGICERFGVQR